MQTQIKRAASDGILPELEQARARAAAGAAQVLNETLIQQLGLVAGAAATTAVIPATTFVPNPGTHTKVSATVTGIAAAGATSASTAQIQHSDDGGATWVTDEAAPLSAMVAAGIAAATTSGATLYFDYLNSSWVTGRQVRVSVTMVGAGGTFTTTASQGAMRIS